MPKTEKKNKVQKFRWLLWLIVFLFLIICLGLTALLFSSKIQKKSADKVLQNISKKINSKISLEEVSFDLWKGVEFNHLFIEDHKKDTLLYVESFSTSVTESIKALFSKQLNFNEITLNGSRLFIRSYPSDSQNSLEIFLNKFKSEETLDTIQKSKPLNIDIQQINVSDFYSLIQNKSQENSWFNLKSGKIQFDTFDLQSKKIALSTLELENPIFHLKDLKKNPIKTNDEIIVEKKGGFTPLTEKQSHTWNISIENINLKDGDFTRNQEQRKKIGQSFDKEAFTTKSVNIDASNLHTDLSNHLSFDQLETEMIINQRGEPYQATISNVKVSPKKTIVDLIKLKKGQSYFSTDLELKYAGFNDFKNFVDYVFIQSNIKPSKINFDEVIYFVPQIKEVKIFAQNQQEAIKVEGGFRGRINNFNIKDLNLDLGSKIFANAEVRIKDITDKDKTFLALNIHKSKSTVNNLRDLIPGFIFPPQFYKLGNLEYDGNFNGFLYDFVSYGKIKTSLGNADLDIRLDIKDGREKAKYSGKLNLYEFDLKKWSNDDRFGSLTMNSTIKNAQGLTLTNLKANVEANIESLDYSGYHYENVALNGTFAQNEFNGIFNIKDNNLDLNFDGNLKVSDSLNLVLDLKANVQRIDVYALNLVDEPLIIEGAFDLELEGKELVDFVGTADIDSLTLFYKGKQYDADSIFVSSSPSTEGNRNILITSDFANFILQGKIDFNDLKDHIIHSLVDHFGTWAGLMNVEKSNKLNLGEEDFKFKLEIKDSRELLDLVQIPCVQVEDFTAQGAYNSEDEQMYFESNFYNIKCDGLEAFDVDMNLNYFKGNLKSNLNLGSYMVNGKEFPSLNLNVNTENEKVALQVKTENVLNNHGNLNFTVNGIADHDSIRIHADQLVWNMLDADWFFAEDNEMIISKNSIFTKNFLLTDGDRGISFESYNNEGLTLLLQQFDVHLLNSFIKFDKVYFSGKGDAKVRMKNIFVSNESWVEIALPSLSLNNEDYGKVNINIFSSNYNEISGNIAVLRQEDGQRIYLDYATNISERTLDSYLKTENFDISFLELIIPEGINDTYGSASLTATISGDYDNIRLDSDILLQKGGTTVEYLNNAIKFENQRIRITDKIMDFSNAIILDKEGNQATVSGGLKHQFFKEFEADVKIQSDRFIALNTTKENNQQYYGLGVGEIDISFLGPLQKMYINVNATTAGDSELNIPINSGQSNYNESFITFIDKKELIEESRDTIFQNTTAIKGVNVDMNLTMTPEAQVNIIFDEKLNDVIKGRGSGDMTISIKRTGEFDIFGDYEIDRGQYVFTALGFVAKPFAVEKGSLITWSGDPVNAELKIKANLEGLRVPMNVFLQEYIEISDDLIAEASRSTDVQLGLIVSGTLFEPQVSFDLDFPELNGELKNYADNKMRTLRANTNELNDQVAGLLLFQTFLPSTNSLSNISGATIFQSTINTMSGFVSAQLSHYISGFFNEVLSDQSFITGIDFKLGFNNSTNSFISEATQGPAQNNSILPDEIEVHLVPQFQNDRWGLDVGTNYVRQSLQGTKSNYTVNDFVVEYYLTEDRKLKMRAYGKYDYDLVNEIEAREQIYGVGLSYRRQFGNLRKFKKQFKKDIIEMTKALDDSL